MVYTGFYSIIERVILQGKLSGSWDWVSTNVIIFHTLYIENEVLKCCLNEVMKSLLSKPNCIIQLNTWIHSQSLSVL